MGGICHIIKEEHFVWGIRVRKSTAKRLLSDDNPMVDFKINDLELAAYVSHIHIFCAAHKSTGLHIN